MTEVRFTYVHVLTTSTLPCADLPAAFCPARSAVTLSPHLLQEADLVAPSCSLGERHLASCVCPSQQ
jgi:hypothetical protein